MGFSPPLQDLDDTQDDLATHVACLAQFVSTVCFRQRQNGLNDWPEFSGIDKLCNFR